MPPGVEVAGLATEGQQRAQPAAVAANGHAHVGQEAELQQAGRGPGRLGQVSHRAARSLAHQRVEASFGDELLPADLPLQKAIKLMRLQFTRGLVYQGNVGHVALAEGTGRGGNARQHLVQFEIGQDVVTDCPQPHLLGGHANVHG